MSRGTALSWDALIPHFIHPTKVQIIEAMLWIDRPLSAAELARVFDGDPNLSSVWYHMKCFVEPGLLLCTGTQKVRGATKRHYRLASEP